MSSAHIPREACKEGYTYKIRSRNLRIGVFHKRRFGGSKFESGFVGIREKFGNLYLFTEYHHDDGAPYGTVYPESEIEKCPVENLDETVGDFCDSCQEPLDYSMGGNWRHKPGSTCTKLARYAKPNQPLFDYLANLEGPYQCNWCRTGVHERHRQPDENFGLVCLCPSCRSAKA